MISTTVQSLTFEDYLAYDDGTDHHYELVDGQLILMNPPRIEHFIIAKFLEKQFDLEIHRLSLPWLTFREVGIRTGYQRSRLADLCIVTHEQVNELMGRSAVFQTPPKLVIEVISPDSIARDYRYKRSEYAALGIPEYWIVDPLEIQVMLLQWEEGWYEEVILKGEHAIASAIFPDLNITVDQILCSQKLF